MADHTPGPWQAERRTYPNQHRVEEISGDGGKHAVIRPEGDELSVRRADLDLICAAPDLLAACRCTLEMLGDDAHAYRAGELAREAIAKAEGKTGA